MLPLAPSWPEVLGKRVALVMVSLLIHNLTGGTTVGQTNKGKREKGILEKGAGEGKRRGRRPCQGSLFERCPRGKIYSHWDRVPVHTL